MFRQRGDDPRLISDEIFSGIDAEPMMKVRRDANVN